MIYNVALRALDKEATKKGISLRSFVNKILKNYVTSEMYFEELGFILVSKDFLRKVFANIDKKNLEEFGREYGLTIAKEYVSYFYPKVDGSTLTQFLDIWFKRFQSYNHRTEREDEDDNNIRHYFSVKHDINMNFSIVLKAILEVIEAMRFDIEEGNFSDTLLEKIGGDDTKNNNNSSSTSHASINPDLMKSDLDLLKKLQTQMP